ncbi:MAG: methylthioribose-1-phosphate isomerase [Acidithiobacillales bacterium SM23_46]|nr:MAG: methylthioribose-1-phosphate isomerase [Acidithiobacillales bacterium SM23_46]
MSRKAPIETIAWTGECVRLIDQTLLPAELRHIEIGDVEQLWEAIRTLRVRGAPAIGIAAALGCYLGVRNSAARDFETLRDELARVCDYLGSARPTAVNLFWALRRVQERVERLRDKPVEQIKQALLDEALAMIEEDHRVCRAIGRHGADLLRDGDSVLTHCNAGGLATAGYGTALAPVFLAAEQGKRIHVYVDETRPLLQGARLTAWECQQAGIPATLICDNMAATVMAQGKVHAVLVGTDRTAANGDVANKIGTLGLAVAAREFGVPFYVAAPLSSIDMAIASGAEIPIEERSPDEVTCGFGCRTAPEGIEVYNPAFDVTPHRYVTAIITERGLVRPSFDEGLRRIFDGEL